MLFSMIRKETRFNVGRKLTDAEWKELKQWIEDNPDKRLRGGDFDAATGKYFRAYQRGAKNGERWDTQEQRDYFCKTSAEYSAMMRKKNPDYMREYQEKNRDKLIQSRRDYYQANKDEFLKKCKDRYEKNKERINQRGREYYKKNRDKFREASREWYERNKEKVAAYVSQWRKENRSRINETTRARRAKDPVSLLKSRCRSRLGNVLARRQIKKSSSTEQMIGCSWKELKRHIESQFLPGMSWENKSEWHLDHIIPLAHAQTEEDVLRLCRWENLQPLWGKDNLRKSDKLPCGRKARSFQPPS